MSSLKKRKDLKRSADEGKAGIYDFVRKIHRSVDNLLDSNELDDTLALLESAPELGRGTYGEAKEMSDNIVCKITGCASNLLGPLNSIWRSENIEPTLLRVLWEYLVETKMTPHLIAPLGNTHAIIEGATNSQKKADGVQNSLIYFMEKATAGTVREYLTRHSGGKRFDLVFKVILFQICYTLECIYALFPRFRHNDLKDDNVFLHKSTSTGCTAYTIHGRTFYIPNVGVTALISDFDFACISGSLLDNYKVIEQEWETPSYNISTRKNHAADIGLFVSYALNQFDYKFTNVFKASMKRQFGKVPSKNSFRYTLEQSGELPTTKEMLSSMFFEDYLMKDDDEEVVERFVFNPPPAPPLPTPPTVSSEEIRHTPLFIPRFGDAIDPRELKSFQHFRLWKPVRNDLDDDEPAPFCERVCERIVNHMRELYSLRPNPKKDIAGFGFEKEKEQMFFDTVEQTGASFILDYYVPSRWWPAIYTCVFVDTIEEMDLCVSNQVCWHMGQWCDFWKRAGEANYTEMELLHVALQWGWIRE